MKILIVTNNPHRASFRQRVGEILRLRVNHGLDFQIAQLPKGILGRKSLLKKGSNFDAVLLHKKILNPVDSFWLQRYAKRVIYDFDDAIMYSASHPGRVSRKRRSAFARTIKLADLVLAGNQYLADHARNYNSNIEILPTGLHIRDYEDPKEYSKDNKIRLVWIGSNATLKYFSLIRDPLIEIAKRHSNVVLKIISDKFPRLNFIEVERCPWSLERQGTDLSSADIGLAPLPKDKFTQGKCGFKILQYQAAGLPVVASPVGFNVELINQGVDGFLAEDEKDWVDKLSILISDSVKRKKFGESGKEKVKQFDLEVVGERWHTLIHKTIGS